MSKKFDGIEDRHVEVIKERYTGLIIIIARKIGGDRVVFDFEDCCQELFIVALEALESLRRLQFPEFSYDQILDYWGFDKYVKSCLWHKKGSLGSKITKKIINGPIKHRFSELDFGTNEGIGADLAVYNSPPIESSLKRVPKNGPTGSLLEFLLQNVEDVLTKDYSSVRVSFVAQELETKPHIVMRFLESLKARIKPYLENLK